MDPTPPRSEVRLKFGDEPLVLLHRPLPHPERPYLFILIEWQDRVLSMSKNLHALRQRITIEV